MRRIARIGEADGDAPRAAGGKRRAPAGLARGQFEHRLVARGLAEQAAPELEGILARGVRHLVHEALDDEPVLRGTDRAPEAEGDPVVLLHPLHPHVRNVVGHVARAFHRGRVNGSCLHAALLNQDAGADHAIPPRHRLAFVVEGGLEDVVGRGTVEAVLEIVLARPDHLDGHADSLGCLQGVHDEVLLTPSAEAAAEEGGVDDDLLHGHTRDARARHLGAARILRGRPDLARIGLDVGGGVHRFQACVLEEGHLVDRLYGLAARRETLVRVAIIARNLPRLPRRGLIALADAGAADGGYRTFIPDHLERLAPARHRPERIAHHRDAVRDLHHVLDAPDPLGRGAVEALDLAAENGAALDRGDEHARHLDVHAVDGGAIDLERRVATGHGLADVAELIRRLELGVLRHGQLGRLVDERAVGQPPARRLVNDRVRLRGHVVERHAPLVGARLHEHLARRRSHLAQHGDVIAHAAAAAIGLAVRYRIRVELGIGGGLVDADLTQIRIELVGHDGRHGRQRSLTHLRDGIDDRDEAVAIDLDPLVGREDAGRLRQRRAPPRHRQAETHHETRSHREAALDERASADPGLGRPQGGHHAPPFLICAARWMPARIRWYVPQRQMLPAMASSMSVSVGVAFWASSAAAERICPDWQ